MSDFSLAPRRRPLWRLFIMPVLLVVAAIAWSGFWFYAASQVDVRADAWRAQEAKSGRVYDCANRSVAGFPFRLEVRCDGASVSLVSQTAEQAATQVPLTARLGEILVVAQIYDPKLLIAEFTAPATISDRGQPSMTVNWSKARSSVVGLPAVPQRASIVFDDPSIDHVNGSTQAQLAGAKHVELHGRLAEGSALDHPVIETVLQIAGGSVQGLHPLLTQPFDADVRTMLSGLHNAGVRVVMTLRNVDNNKNPAWAAQLNPPNTTAGQNEWWEHAFATVYELDVRNNYGIDDWEIHNEPDNSGQGWAGTLADYEAYMTLTADAIRYVYATYLPGRTPHIYAPVTTGGSSWPDSVMKAVPGAFDSVDVHDYQSDITSYITTVHNYMNADGFANAPLWLSEWATYRGGGLAP